MYIIAKLFARAAIGPGSYAGPIAGREKKLAKDHGKY